MKLKSVLAFLLSVVTVVGVAAATYFLLIQTTGTVGTITTPGLSATPSTIDWGTVYPNGTAYVRSVTLTNTGTQDFANLNMTYGNPSANLIDYTVTWDAEGAALTVGTSLIVTFTLTINDATPGAFTLDIQIQE